MSTAGDACSPPQAAREARIAKHMKISAAVSLVLGNLTCILSIADIVGFPLQCVKEPSAGPRTLPTWNCRGAGPHPVVFLNTRRRSVNSHLTGTLVRQGLKFLAATEGKHMRDVHLSPATDAWWGRCRRLRPRQSL